MAPLPTKDSSDDPLTFVAITFAWTLEPQSRLNGALRRTEAGIEHYFAVTIAGLAPLQFTLSQENVKPSLCLIKIENDVISAPLASGALKLTMTLLGLKTVVGAAGFDGG